MATGIFTHDHFFPPDEALEAEERAEKESAMTPIRVCVNCGTPNETHWRRNRCGACYKRFREGDRSENHIVVLSRRTALLARDRQEKRDMLAVMQGAEKAFQRLHARTGEAFYLDMIAHCTARQSAIAAELGEVR